jgi:hypothetical protein
MRKRRVSTKRTALATKRFRSSQARKGHISTLIVTIRTLEQPNNKPAPRQKKEQHTSHPSSFRQYRKHLHHRASKFWARALVPVSCRRSQRLRQQQVQGSGHLHYVVQPSAKMAANMRFPDIYPSSSCLAMLLHGPFHQWHHQAAITFMHCFIQDHQED